MPQKIIEVPGVGNVEFPETMSDQEISVQISRTLAGAPPAPGSDAATVRAWLDKRYPDQPDQQNDYSIGGLMKGALVNTWKGLWGMATRTPRDRQELPLFLTGGPLGLLVEDMAEAHLATGKKALGAAGEAARAIGKGDAAGAQRAGLEAAGYGAATLLPGIGPAAAGTGEKIGEGKVSEGVGEALAMTALPAAASRLKSVRVAPRIGKNLNPTEAAAVEFGMREGIPVDAATATGNKMVAGLQQTAEFSPTGSIVSQRARLRQTEALAATGNRIADQVFPRPVVPEQAGAGVRGNLDLKIQGLKAQEDAAYGAFRRIEGDPKNVQTVTLRTELPAEADQLAAQLTGNKRFSQLTPQQQDMLRDVAAKMGVDISERPVTVQMPLPVDMRPIKARLQPLYERMQMWLEPAKRNASQGFTALKSIVEGPDYMPASIAEEGLSGLKTLAREAKSPALRDVNQGAAALATKELQAAIDTTVSGAGQDAIQALRMGRAKHLQKMTVAEVLDELREEPVQAFGQLTYAKDSGVELLRKVARHAPTEMRKVGRAYLEDLFGKATAEGGLNRTNSLWNSWQALGPQTKNILFGSATLVRDLDNLFLLAKRMAERPNPSGSAVVGSLNFGIGYLVRSPLQGSAFLIAGAPLAKMFYSPRAIRALMRGMSVPVGNKAAAAIEAGQILKLAGGDAKPVLSLPEPQSGPGATPPAQ